MCGITACVSVNRGAPSAKGDDHSNGLSNGYENLPSKAIASTNFINGSSTQTLLEKLEASINAINHRGPDETGTWISEDGSVALGHCRLSINDLTPSGRQPLTSDDGNIHAVVNGEIYDQDRLRKLCAEVHGYRFSSESDSELVLALYKIFGAPGFFEHLRGEFAFVLYDDRPGKRRVIAARDRFGIKPMVWTTVGEKVLMAAEAKAFLPLGWKPEWDVKAIATSGWQLDDRTLFKGVRKLLPGHWLEITDNGLNTYRYWDAEYEDKVGHPHMNT